MIDWNKPIQTRDGRKARKLGDLAHAAFGEPIVCAVTGRNGLEFVACYAPSGEFYGPGRPARVQPSDSDMDLVNAPPAEVFSDVVYVNEFDGETPSIRTDVLHAEASVQHCSRYTQTSEWRFSSTRGWVNVGSRKFHT